MMHAPLGNWGRIIFGAKMEVDKILTLLNCVLEHDREALQNLIDHRVPINEQLTSRLAPLIVCTNNGVNSLGLLGIINGILLAAGSEKIVTAIYVHGELNNLSLEDAPENEESDGNY